jgi:hypothetical protein
MNDFEDAISRRNRVTDQHALDMQARIDAERAEAQRLSTQLVEYLQSKNIPTHPIFLQDAGYKHEPSFLNVIMGNASRRGYKYYRDYTQVGDGWVFFDGPDYIDGEGHRDVYGIDTEARVFKPSQSLAGRHGSVGDWTTIDYISEYERIIVGSQQELDPRKIIQVLNSDQVLDYLSTHFI